ncbi:molybdenum cofactor guanylyltransferase [Tuberibacillus sp. Marseille-P3662]|uniref:molybdenum cofactor guanylyltransferase n=1 Tax=Tuberibacillus sp. Marseille-P3662 TaxID=1965358 RepID=UPI000A1CC4B0|nr:molybdenum cofactor guanylyltransferase [Tuberibacillus sp. Marseille-P3662]
MVSVDELGAAILAGGASRRFGSHKSLALLHGKTMVESAVASVKPLTNNMVIVSHPDIHNNLEQMTGLPTMVDEERFQGHGPLAGIYSAFQRLNKEWLMVVPCDVPNLSESFLRWLLSCGEHEKSIDGIIPRSEGRLQPLIAVYHRNSVPVIEKLLNKGQRRMQDLIEQMRFRIVSADGHFPPETFVNVNDRQTLNEFVNSDG